MPELRKDPIVQRWVVMAPDRAKRPSDVKDDPKSVEGEFDPFAEGNESATPPEIMAYRNYGSQPNEPGWRVRVVPNKFPALQIEGNLEKRGDGIYDMMNGIGAHEVIIECPHGETNMSRLSVDNIREVLWVYHDRLVDLKRDRRLVHALVFKNKGALAGASLQHSHSQLMATSVVPITIYEEINGALEFFNYRGRSIFDLATDEVYGKFGGVLADHGCPWGWVRILDIKKVTAPKVLSEYKLKENTEAFCTTQTDRRTENFTSFSAHNPTVVSPDLALVTWHGKGLQAIDLRNPAKPVSAGEWIPPNPLATVATEDPALGGGNVDNVAGGTRDKVIMWSFPVVVNGLIYVVDLRNGLYILKYDGVLSPAVKATAFLEGNSNVGQVLAAQAARRPGGR